jgi:hypothetical protein
MSAARQIAAAAVVLLAGGGGVACINSAAPTGFVFQYQVGAYGCDTTCATAGDSAITSAARGDTVWVFHLVRLINAIDPAAPQFARLRPTCAENVVILASGTTVRSLPAPADCPDSTYRQAFTLLGTDWPTTVSWYTRWVVDAALTPGGYAVRGRVMVQPQIEPTFDFTVQ